MVHLFLADGFEEIEALATVDVLRRCGIEVQTVSVTEEIIVEGAHGVGVVADELLESVDVTDSEALILPGGMPGAETLANTLKLQEILKVHAAKGGLCCAICAAPMVLGRLGLLKGRRATCYPGFEKFLEGAEYTATAVEEDGSFITANGPSSAVDFACAIGKKLGADVENVRKGMLYRA